MRQCTAALLNVAATNLLGGDCNGAFPGLTELLDGCCGPASVPGTDVPNLSIGTCIDAVGAFNNTESDTVTFPFNTGPAKSGPCGGEGQRRRGHSDSMKRTA